MTEVVERRAAHSVTKGEIAEAQRKYNVAVNRQMLFAAYNFKHIVDPRDFRREKCGACPSCVRAMRAAEQKRIRRRLKRLLVAGDYENFERLLLSLGHVQYVEQVLGLNLTHAQREELATLMLQQKGRIESDRAATESE